MNANSPPDGDTGPGLPRRPSPPLDSPDATALVGAVATWLRDDLMPRSDGADRWGLRIAVNALEVAAREMADGPGVVEAHGRRLAALGYEDERDLCDAIRAGAEDDRFVEVLDAVAAGVEDSLSLANPGYRGVEQHEQ